MCHHLSGDGHEVEERLSVREAGQQRLDQQLLHRAQDTLHVLRRVQQEDHILLSAALEQRNHLHVHCRGHSLLTQVPVSTRHFRCSSYGVLNWLISGKCFQGFI